MACPTCGHGVLLPEDLDGRSDAKSQADRSDERWEPEYDEGVFFGVLRCNYPSCREHVAVAGRTRIEVRGGDYELEPVYRVQYIDPPLTIMQIPTKTPPEVADAIVSASKVLWTDPSAAANKLRHAVELLMTAKRIPATKAKKSGGRSFVSVDLRIKQWKAKSAANEPAAEQLLAVKWIGNIGSHDSELTPTDVLKGAELMRVALEYMYETSRKDLLKLAATIVAKGGKASAKTLRAKKTP